MSTRPVGLSLLGETRERLSRFVRGPFFGRASAQFDQSGSITLSIETLDGPPLSFTGTEALLDAIEKPFRSQIREKLNTIFENSEPLQLSLPFKRTDDRPSRHLKLNLLSSDAGFRYEGSFAEVKPLHSAIDQMSTVERDLTQVLSVVPDLLFKLNSKGQFLGIFSSKIDTTFGSNEFIGKTPGDVFDPELASVVDETIQRTFMTGIPQVSECRIELPDGPMVYDVRVAILDDESCVLFLRDSHQVINTNLTASSGVSSEELIGRYLIHEIAGPIQLIDIQVANLKRECKAQIEKNESVVRALEKLQTAVGHSKNIIKYMRYFLGDPQNEPMSEIDVEGLITLTGEILDPVVREQEKQLNWKIDLIGRKWIARKTLIVQMLVNLIQNAIEASVGNSQSIDIGLQIVGDEMMITVSNVGREISQKDLRVLSRLFESTKNSQKNMGIGLFWICRIVNLHSGEISVRQDGERTVFQIDLPLSPPNP